MNKDDHSFVLLEMYKSLRAETNLTLQLQQNILSWSSVAVGVILLFALKLWKESPALAFGFFILVFPGAAMMFLNIWLTEVARMGRVGRYLYLLENKLSHLFPDDKLVLYEHWLKEDSVESNRHFISGYKSGVAIYLGIVVFSHIVANVIFWHNKDDLPIHIDFIYKIIFSCSTVLFNFALIIITHKRIRRHIL